jgi:cytochrome c oxidase assembly protein subunit 15
VVTVPVTIAAGLAWLGALRRRPYRRDLVWLAALLPLGVIGQAVLGGFTVKGALDYGWVMGHFALSMLILVAAVLLVFRASNEHDEPGPVSGGQSLVWPLRGKACDSGAGGAGDLRWIAVTASGRTPAGRPARRSTASPDGRGTMDFVIHRHAEIAPCSGSWPWACGGSARRAGGSAGGVRRPLTVLCVLLALQGP